MKIEPFNPTWNYLPRTLLIYVLPLAALAVCLELPLVDGLWGGFWVAAIWGWIIPWWNIRHPQSRPWAFKDYHNRDVYYPTIALLHGTAWVLCLHFSTSPWAAALAFFAVLMLYDALLLRYRILSVYALPLKLLKRGALATLLGFGIAWWSYVALGLLLNHVYGGDTLWSIAVGSLAMIAPAQLGLQWLRRRSVQRLGSIQKVAVVGAGWAGLHAIKWLRKEGLEVECFEAGPTIGGVWAYRDFPGGVAAGTRATSSKHFLHASDFPFPEHAPDFPYHQQVLDYLRSYAQHFGLESSIRFNTRVTKIRKTGWRWKLDLQQTPGIRSTRTFDAVVICSGPHQNPRLDPSHHPLYRRFAGPVMHAGEYKRVSDWTPGERILVVGAGESAADIVSEAAQSGVQVYWSSRHGQWFADRNIGPFAADHFAAIGIRTLLGRFFLFEHLIRRLIIGPFIDLAWGRGGHGIAEWEPAAPYLHQFVNKSRDAVLEFYRGRVSPRRSPTAILGKRVFFQNGEPAEVDRIVLATGYEPCWDLLDQAPRRLFKLVFDVEEPTLACVGFVRPVLGSIPSLAELQARWLARVWSGQCELPSMGRRRTITHYDRIDKSRHLLDSSRMGVLVDQEVYAGMLASFVGAQVPWLRLLVTNLSGFIAVLWSPWTAFKYRLSDPEAQSRVRAVRRIQAEMPQWRRPGRGGHPVFLLVWGIAGFFTALASGSILALWMLPPTWVAAGMAIGVLALALSLRFGIPGRTPLPGRKRVFRAASKPEETFETGTSNQRAGGGS